MKFRIHVKDERNEWWEEYDKIEVVDLTSAEVCAKQMIERYNATLYPGDKPRTLLEVQLGGEGKRAHVYEKTNLVTIRGRSGSLYDLMKCSVCGCEARRYGLLQSVQRIGKFKARKWEHCPGNKENVKY